MMCRSLIWNVTIGLLWVKFILLFSNVVAISSSSSSSSSSLSSSTNPHSAVGSQDELDHLDKTKRMFINSNANSVFIRHRQPQSQLQQHHNVMQNNAKFNRLSNYKSKHSHNNSHTHKIKNSCKKNLNHRSNKNVKNAKRGCRRQDSSGRTVNYHQIANIFEASGLGTTVWPTQNLEFDIEMPMDNITLQPTNISDGVDELRHKSSLMPQLIYKDSYKVRRRHAKRWHSHHHHHHHHHHNPHNHNHQELRHFDLNSKLMLDENGANTFASNYQHEQPAAIMLDDSQMLSESFGEFEVQSLLKTTKYFNETNDLTIHWPVKKEAIVEGDVILGGLMMVHSREDLMMCGPIMPQGGIQALEAMLYTLDKINEDKILLPNIKIGAHILDDCDRDSYGLEMAVDFIKGSISNIDGGEYHCNKTQVRKVISGVVGAASSVTSIQVANLLRLFRIPQVSFFSTSPELSNKQRFEYFSRTIPSDHYQVKAMVDIVRRMGWSYVSIIYEESNYGIKAFEELEDLLAKHNICIAVKEKLVKDSGVAEEIAYDNIVQKLLTKPRARGAIIFGSDQEVREVMRAVRRNNATGTFSWIGSDGWSARNLVSDGNEPEVEGTLSVQPQANPVVGFEQHFLSLTVENNARNPWFVEFWEDHFKCRYPNSSLTPYNKKYDNLCTKKEKLQKNTTAFEGQLQFVSDAVMAFAYALSDMHKDLCRGVTGLCDAMRPTKGADLLKYLRKVNFTGLSGDRFHFNSNGDGPARYNIIHFKQVETGKYRWIKVGEYYEGELRLDMHEVQFKSHQPKPPESVCSLPCEKGQAKKYVEGESCCWHCFNCSLYQIRHPIDETQCLTCKKGTIPDRYKQYCQDIPEQYLKLESAWAIGAMAFSSTGMLVTFFVVGVFLRHNDTPVVRASGRELSYVLLAGIIMCYLVTFALVLRPTDIVCGLQRFGAGFCFTVVYGALLTKTNRISRIFKHGKQSAKRPSFISPRSQLAICAALTSVQVLVNVIWMIISPARAMHHYPTREDNLLVCDSYVDASYMIAFSYPIFLIVICTVYAVLTRKIPEAFNESKHIGFTMYTTCVIWLAFVPLYFGTANHVPLRLTSMSVTISLSASVTVICLFSPKLYIILIRPERNVRQSMMPVRNKTTATGSSSMTAAIMVTAATCNQNEKIEKLTSIIVAEDTNKLKISNAINTGVNGNGGPPNIESSYATFVDIATQTLDLTSILTNCNVSPYCKNAIDLNRDRIINAEVNTNLSPNETTSQHFKTEQLNNNGHCMVDTATHYLHEIASNDVDDSKRQISEQQFDESTRMVSPSTTTAAATAAAVIREISNGDKYTSMDDNSAEGLENLSHKKPIDSSNESNENETIENSLDTAITPSVSISNENDCTIVCTSTDVLNGPANNLYV